LWIGNSGKSPKICGLEKKTLHADLLKIERKSVHYSIINIIFNIYDIIFCAATTDEKKYNLTPRQLSHPRRGWLKHNLD
jgi:hypothetical protein